jgi:hypothetical protein
VPGSPISTKAQPRSSCGDGGMKHGDPSTLGNDATVYARSFLALTGATSVSFNFLRLLGLHICTPSAQHLSWLEVEIGVIFGKLGTGRERIFSLWRQPLDRGSWRRPIITRELLLSISPGFDQEYSLPTLDGSSRVFMIEVHTCSSQRPGK